MAGDFYDKLETRSADQREADLMAALRETVALAKSKTAFYAEAFKDVDPAALKDRAALATLPVLRKSEMAARQKANRPLGGFNAEPIKDMAHMFASPGGIYEPGGRGKDHGRFARGLWAAGVRPGDLVHNTFSYHLVPAGLMVESGAHAIGCPVFPAGVGNTEVQAQVIADLKPAAYVGTPSFLRILLAKIKEMGLAGGSLKKGLCGAEALTPSLRQELADQGVETFNTYGTAELGLLAYESAAREGMILEEEIIVELVEPGGSAPVPAGETGEVVVTTFSHTYPLIRFATGDLSAIMPGQSPCGRTAPRIRGWMGRADQSTKVKGMFVHPAQVMEVARRHPEITKARLVVTSADNVDVMTLRCAVTGGGNDLKQAIAASLQAVTKLRGGAEFVDAAALPDDGRMIEDARTYD
jgi:phenylacetate-CoA ligase